MSCLGKIFWGCMFLLFLAAIIWAFSLVVIVVFAAILFGGIISIFARKDEKSKETKDE